MWNLKVGPFQWRTPWHSLDCFIVSSPNDRKDYCLASKGPDLERLRRARPSKEASLTLRNTQRHRHKEQNHKEQNHKKRKNKTFQNKSPRRRYRRSVDREIHIEKCVNSVGSYEKCIVFENWGKAVGFLAEGSIYSVLAIRKNCIARLETEIKTDSICGNRSSPDTGVREHPRWGRCH